MIHGAGHCQETARKKKLKEMRAKAKAGNLKGWGKGRGRGKGKRKGARKGRGKGKGRKSEARNVAPKQERMSDDDEEGSAAKQARLKSQNLDTHQDKDAVFTGARDNEDDLALQRRLVTEAILANPVAPSSSSASSSSAFPGRADISKTTDAPDAQPADATLDSGHPAAEPAGNGSSLQSDVGLTQPMSVDPAFGGGDDAHGAVADPLESGASEIPRDSQPSATRGPLGPRGPNVHSTPASLADASPPGCTIGLNST